MNREGFQAAVHHLQRYRGVKVVRRKPMPEVKKKGMCNA